MVKNQLFLLLLLTALICDNWAIAQAHHRLIVQEIMADPTPAVALPAYEWVEIKNTSKEVIALQHWRFTAGTSLSSPFPVYFLAPDSLLILCSAVAQTALGKYGKTMGLPVFPSLSNEGETVSLRDPSGKTVHAVTYSTEWYAFPWKAEGGWSLELIDAANPCQEQDNWKASIDVNGGTPGQQNQTSTIPVGVVSTKATYAFFKDASTMQVVFNRPVDSCTISKGEWIHISPGISWQSIRLVPPKYTEAILHFSQPVLPDSVVQLTITKLANCSGMKESASWTIKTGLAGTAIRNSVTLNEILFNPRSGGEEFVECLNTSKKIIALSDLRIALRNSGGQLGSSYKLAGDPIALLPGQYIAFSKDPYAIQREYLIPASATLQKIHPFVTLPNEEGRIVLLNTQGEVLDELHYDESWHFELLQQKEGVSLEKLDPTGVTQNRNNWHSAASTVGFATPGQKNSQSISSTSSQGNFEIIPPVFSPDLDGWEDFCSLQYRGMGTGQVISVTVVDVSGAFIIKLVPRALLSTHGHFSWNGTTASGKSCKSGTYVFIIEQYDLSGKTKISRLPVTITYSLKKV